MSPFKLEFQSGNARGENLHFLSRVTLKFDGRPWKIIGHHFYATSSFVHYFIAIGEFKLELQSGNAQFGSKSAIFVPRDLEIRRMILKNNKALLLCSFKLCASFHNHKQTQTARKCPNWSKICFDLCDIDLWPLALISCIDFTSVNDQVSQTDGQKCS